MIIQLSTAHCIISLVNLIVCLLLGVLCITRINTRKSRKILKYRMKYIIVLVGAVASGLQPMFWSTFPDFGTLIFSCSVLYLFISNHRARLDI